MSRMHYVNLVGVGEADRDPGMTISDHIFDIALSTDNSDDLLFQSVAWMNDHNVRRNDTFALFLNTDSPLHLVAVLNALRYCCKNVWIMNWSDYKQKYVAQYVH